MSAHEDQPTVIIPGPGSNGSGPQQQPGRGGAPWWVVGALGAVCVVLLVLTTLGFSRSSNSSGDVKELKSELADSRARADRLEKELTAANSQVSDLTAGSADSSSHDSGPAGGSGSGADPGSSDQGQTLDDIEGAPAFSDDDRASVLSQTRQTVHAALGQAYDSCADTTLVGASEDGAYAITRVDVQSCHNPTEPGEFLWHRSGATWVAADPKIAVGTVICGERSRASVEVRTAITEICAEAGRATG